MGKVPRGLQQVRTSTISKRQGRNNTVHLQNGAGNLLNTEKTEVLNAGFASAFIIIKIYFQIPQFFVLSNSLRKKGTPHDRKRDLGLSLRMMDLHKSLVAGSTYLRILRELAGITAILGSFSLKGVTEWDP